MSIISFTYRCCLDLVHKESLFQIVAFLGVSASKSANMPSMIWEIDSYAREIWQTHLGGGVKELDCSKGASS